MIQTTYGDLEPDQIAQVVDGYQCAIRMIEILNDVDPAKLAFFHHTKMH